jgi:hypothetical protein
MKNRLRRTRSGPHRRTRGSERTTIVIAVLALLVVIAMVVTLT